MGVHGWPSALTRILSKGPFFPAAVASSATFSGRRRDHHADTALPALALE